MKYILIIFFALLAFSFINAKENNYYGKEFVFAVGKNVIFLNEYPKKEIKMNLFSKESGNNIKLYYKEVLILDTLLNKNEILSYKLNQINDIEIIGKSYISDNIFKIECSQNSTVNIISSTFNSTDATMLIPTNNLGKVYTLSSMNNYIINQNPLDTNNFYGFALVISLEDETNLSIRSDSKFYDGLNDVNNLNLKLQKNQVFYFTCGVGSDLYDLTGTNIKSDKKIAIISGHRCARILNITNSRDFLLNQIPPDFTNGLEYIIGNFHRKDTEYLPIFRVISLYDKNKISFNNQNYILNKGEWKQFILDSLTLLKSEKPIIVAEYMKTMPEFILGDPFLLTLTPTEQYVNNYSYTVPKVEEILKHFVAITCIDTIANKIQMNGNLLDQSKFEKVSNSNYFYGVFPVYTDSVILSSKYDFGAIAFGVGVLDSYGMNLGSNLRNIENIILDKSPANVRLDDCSNQIQIVDSSEFTSGIETVNYYNPTNLDNINLTSSKNTVLLDYKLIDPTKDAQISLSVVDSSQNKVDTTLNIKGFTIKASLYIPNELGLNKLESWELELVNTGRFTQNLTFQMLDGHLVSLPAGFRQSSVESSKTDSVSIFSFSEQPNEYVDTLYIYNECNKLIKIPISVHFGFEANVTTKCNVNYLIGDKYNKNIKVLRTQLFDTNGKLLESFDGFIDYKFISQKYVSKPLIIKEYYEDHIQLSKIIFDN